MSSRMQLSNYEYQYNNNIIDYHHIDYEQIDYDNINYDHLDNDYITAYYVHRNIKYTYLY